MPWDVVQLAPCQRDSRSPVGTALNSPGTGLRWLKQPQLGQVPLLWGRGIRLDGPWSAIPDSAPPVGGLSLSQLVAAGCPRPDSRGV